MTFLANDYKKILKRCLNIILGGIDALSMCNYFKTGLPMHRTTTSTKNDNDVIARVKGPKKATIELLKQFARVYEYNVKLPRGLESMILN